MNSPRPPRLLVRLFDFLMPFDPTHSHRHDIEDLFEERCAEATPLRARLWFAWQVVAAIPFAMRNAMSWLGSILMHFLKTGLRNQRRNLIPSVVSVGGLATAGTVAIVMYLFIDLQVNMDRHHEHLDELYALAYETEASETQATWGNPPAPIGPVVAADHPGVVAYSRLFTVASQISAGGNAFDQRILFVDPGFHELMTIPVLHGRLEGLSEQGTLVLTDRTAIRLFGETDVVGEILQVSFREEPLQPFRITAIVEAPPVKSSFAWEALGSIHDIESGLGTQLDWNTHTSATLVRIPDSRHARSVETYMQRWTDASEPGTDAETQRSIAAYHLIPLRDVPTLSPSLRGSLFNRVQSGSIYVVGFLSLMILFVACFNTVNIAMSAAGRRAREIGVRKAVGSYRSHVVMQFMSEQILLSVFALGVAILAADFVVIPWVDSILGDAGFGLDYVGNASLWIYLTGIFVVTGIGAGLYPAVYMSRFQPTRVLKGVITGVSKRRLANGLLGVQLVFSFVLIAASIVIYRSAVGQRTLEWGYEQHHTFLVNSGEPERLTSLAAGLESEPGIRATSFAGDGIDGGGSSRTLTVGAHTFDVNVFSGSAGYAETMKLDFAAGSSFPDAQTGQSAELLINRHLAQLAGFNQPADMLGKSVRMSGMDYTIRGIVNDFQFQVFAAGMSPAAITVAPSSEYTSLVLDIVPGQEEQVTAQIRDLWRERFPGIPFDGQFQDEMFDVYFQQMEDSARIFLFVALSAFLIATTGLFGLVLMNTTRRARELSVRKVLGATPFDIHRMAQLETLKVVGAAVVLGTIASLFVARMILATLMPDGHVVTALHIIVPMFALTGTSILVTWLGIHRVTGNNTGDILRTRTE